MREARKTAGMTQSDLAERIGVVKATVSSYEAGKSEPDMDKFAAIMNALGVDANYLLSDEMNEATQVSGVLSPAALALAKRYDHLDAHGKRMLETVADLESDRLDTEEYDRAVEIAGAIYKEVIDERIAGEAEARERLLDEQRGFPTRSGRTG